MFTSKESQDRFPAHETALYKTGWVSSPDYKTVWFRIETSVTKQYVGKTVGFLKTL